MTDGTPRDCARIDDELDGLVGSGGHLSAVARRHLDTCERCRALSQALGADEPLAAPPLATRRIANALTRDLAPVTPGVSPAGLAARLAAGAGLVAVALLALMGHSGLQAMTVGQTALTASILLPGVALGSLSLARHAVPGSRHPLPAAWLVGTVAVALLVALGAAFPWPTAGGVSARDWPCAARELAVALPLAATCWWIAGRGLAIPTASLGALVTGLAGLTAFTILQGQCPRQVAPHLLLWHLGALVLLTAAGALVGPRVPLLPRHR